MHVVPHLGFISISNARNITSLVQTSRLNSSKLCTINTQSISGTFNMEVEVYNVIQTLHQGRKIHITAKTRKTINKLVNVLRLLDMKNPRKGVSYKTLQSRMVSHLKTSSPIFLRNIVVLCIVIILLNTMYDDQGLVAYPESWFNKEQRPRQVQLFLEELSHTASSILKASSKYKYICSEPDTYEYQGRQPGGNPRKKLKTIMGDTVPNAVSPDDEYHPKHYFDREKSLENDIRSIGSHFTDSPKLFTHTATADIPISEDEDLLSDVSPRILSDMGDDFLQTLGLLEPTSIQIDDVVTYDRSVNIDPSQISKSEKYKENLERYEKLVNKTPFDDDDDRGVLNTTQHFGKPRRAGTFPQQGQHAVLSSSRKADRLLDNPSTHINLGEIFREETSGDSRTMKSVEEIPEDFDARSTKSEMKRKENEKLFHKYENKLRLSRIHSCNPLGMTNQNTSLNEVFSPNHGPAIMSKIPGSNLKSRIPAVPVSPDETLLKECQNVTDSHLLSDSIVADNNWRSKVKDLPKELESIYFSHNVWTLQVSEFNEDMAHKIPLWIANRPVLLDYDTLGPEGSKFDIPDPLSKGPYNRLDPSIALDPSVVRCLFETFPSCVFACIYINYTLNLVYDNATVAHMERSTGPSYFGGLEVKLLDCTIHPTCDTAEPSLHPVGEIPLGTAATFECGPKALKIRLGLCLQNTAVDKQTEFALTMPSHCLWDAYVAYARSRLGPKPTAEEIAECTARLKFEHLKRLELFVEKDDVDYKVATVLDILDGPDSTIGDFNYDHDITLFQATGFEGGLTLPRPVYRLHDKLAFLDWYNDWPSAGTPVFMLDCTRDDTSDQFSGNDENNIYNEGKQYLVKRPKGIVVGQGYKNTLSGKEAELERLVERSVLWRPDLWDTNKSYAARNNSTESLQIPISDQGRQNRIPGLRGYSGCPLAFQDLANPGKYLVFGFQNFEWRKRPDQWDNYRSIRTNLKLPQSKFNTYGALELPQDFRKKWKIVNSESGEAIEAIEASQNNQHAHSSMNDKTVDSTASVLPAVSVFVRPSPSLIKEISPEEGTNTLNDDGENVLVNSVPAEANNTLNGRQENTVSVPVGNISKPLQTEDGTVNGYLSSDNEEKAPEPLLQTQVLPKVSFLKRIKNRTKRLFCVNSGS